jgi:DNA sulfur modification protein DndB
MADERAEPILTSRAKKLLEALPIDGTTIGNARLTKKLGLSEDELLKIREELFDAGMAKRAKARGGGLCRITKESASTGVHPDEIVESLVRRSNRAAREQAKLRKQVDEKPGAILENKLWLLLYGLEPRWITTDRDPKITLAPQIPSPDAIALFERWGVVAECKSGESDAFQYDGLEDANKAKNALKTNLKKTFGLENIVSLLAVPDLKNVSEGVVNRARQLHTALIDEKRIDYFLRLQRETGIGTKYMFWGKTFRSLMSPENVKVPALRLKIGEGRHAFLFSASAQDLLVRAFVSHRELYEDVDTQEPYKPYQRMLKKKRLGRIKEYIDEFGSFPTPIVVAFDKNAGHHFDLAKNHGDLSDRVHIGTLHLPRNLSSIQVIDGQHRLFGYTRVEPDRERHIVHVIAYEEPLPAKLDPAEMFVQINSEQKPVPQGLLWELYPDIYKPTNAKYYKAIISDALREVITTGSAKGLVSHISSGIKGPITFATLCNEINKGPLISKDGGLVGQISAKDDQRKKTLLVSWFNIFFSTVADCGKDKPGVNENFIHSNVGIVPLLRIYSRVLQKLSLTKGALERKEEIAQTLAKYLKPIYVAYGRRTPGELQNLKRQRVGESGFAETEDEMTSIIQFEHDPEFIGRGAATPIMRLAHETAYSIHQLNRKALASGKCKELLFRTFDYLAFKRRFQNIQFSQDSFAGVLNLLYQEVVEGSGGKKVEGGNRLARLIGIMNIVDDPTIRMLDNLRNYCDHNLQALDKDKRQDAISALKKLTGRDDLSDLSELTTDDFKAATTKILETFKDGFLRSVHEKIGL